MERGYRWAASNRQQQPSREKAFAQGRLEVKTLVTAWASRGTMSRCKPATWQQGQLTKLHLDPSHYSQPPSHAVALRHFAACHRTLLSCSCLVVGNAGQAGTCCKFDLGDTAVTIHIYIDVGLHHRFEAGLKLGLDGRHGPLLVYPSCRMQRGRKG